MRLKEIKIFSLHLLLVLTLALPTLASNKQKVTVEIAYENKSYLPLKRAEDGCYYLVSDTLQRVPFDAQNDGSYQMKIETDWKEGLSALEALQFVAEVKTHRVGEYVFVSEINGIAGIPNKSVWYYKINGEPAKKVAINQPVKSGDVITWIYKQDVCSPKKK